MLPSFHINNPIISPCLLSLPSRHVSFFLQPLPCCSLFIFLSYFFFPTISFPFLPFSFSSALIPYPLKLLFFSHHSTASQAPNLSSHFTLGLPFPPPTHPFHSKAPFLVFIFHCSYPRTHLHAPSPALPPLCVPPPPPSFHHPPSLSTFCCRAAH